MIRPARAVAFAAVALFATFALTDSAPVQAEIVGTGDPAAYFRANAAALPGVELPAAPLANAPAAPAPTQAAPAPANRFASLYVAAPALPVSPFASAPAALPSAARPAPLTSLVEGEARFETADAEQECLANAVYFEARGESLEGQLAVAEVVLNRSRSGRYPATICAVVTQPAQFSFVRRGVIPAADRSCEAWRRAVAIARIAQAGERRLLPRDVLWYHANYVSPSWGRRLARNTQIGLHIFYS